MTSFSSALQSKRLRVHENDNEGTEEEALPTLSIQECLKHLGHRVSSLLRECETMVGSPSKEFQQSLWTLLLDIRPFLFLCSPDEVFMIPVSIARYRTRVAQRDLNHVRLAVRVYIALVRVTVTVPMALCHAFLTLAQLMPVMADLRASAQPHTTRYVECLRFCLESLASHDAGLLQALLETFFDPVTGVGVFTSALTPAAQDMRLTCELEVVTPEAALRQVAESVDSPLSQHPEALEEPGRLEAAQAHLCSRIVTTTQEAAVSVVHCTCSVFGSLKSEFLPLYLSFSYTSVLVALATSLLCVQTDDSSDSLMATPLSTGSSARDSGKRPKLETLSSSPVMVNLHASADSTLRFLLDAQLLAPHVHGPSLLHCIVHYWRITVPLHQRPPRWLREILSWIASTVVSDGVAAAWIGVMLEQRDLLDGALTLLLRSTCETLGRGISRPSARAGGGCHGDELEDLHLLLSLYQLLDATVQECARRHVCSSPQHNPFFIVSGSVPLEDYADFILSCRPPVDLWLQGSTTGAAPSVTHLLWKLFPAETAVPLLEDSLQRARACLPSAESMLAVEASVLAALSCIGEAAATELRTDAASLGERYACVMGEAAAALKDYYDDNTGRELDEDLAVLLGALAVLLRYSKRTAQCHLLAQDILRDAAALLHSLDTHHLVAARRDARLWVLVFTESASLLSPLGQRTAHTHRAVRVVLRCALAPPRRVADSPDALLHFAWRLAGVARGLHRRLLSVLADPNMWDPISAPEHSAAAIGAGSVASPLVDVSVIFPSPADDDTRAALMGYLLQEIDQVMRAFVHFLKELSMWRRGNDTIVENSLVEVFGAIAEFGITAWTLAAPAVHEQDSCVSSNINSTPLVAVTGDPTQQTALSSFSAECVVDVDGDDGKKDGKTSAVAEETEGEVTLEHTPFTAAAESKMPTHGSIMAAVESTHGKILALVAQLVPTWVGSFPPNEHDALVDAALQVLCVSAAYSPKHTHADVLLSTRVATHVSPSIRCGYGGWALRAILERRHAFSFRTFGSSAVSDDEGRDGALWLGCEHVETAVLRLDAVRCALSGEWVLHIPAHCSNESLAGRWQCAATTQGSGGGAQPLRMESEGFAVLKACRGLWEAPETDVEAQSMSLRAANSVMHALGWSAEEVCRHDPSIVGSPFFIALCQTEDLEVREIVLRSLDVLLGPDMSSLDSDDSRTATSCRATRVQALLHDTPPRGGGFAPVMAYILYHHAGSPPTTLVARIAALQQRLGKDLADVPSAVSRALVWIVVNVISLEGDAQLSAWKQQRVREPLSAIGDSAGGGGSDSVPELNPVAFSVFTGALQQVVALGECRHTEEAITGALESPVSVTVASHALVSSVFDVVEHIYDFMDVRKIQKQISRLSAATAGHAPRGGSGPLSETPVSLTTVRRWLLGVASWLRFLGQHSTLISAKLPAMLEACSTIPGLLDHVCLVWHHLICNCATEYLEGNAPAMVVDLVNLELRYSLGPTSLALLVDAMQRLHSQTSSGAFWYSYFRVLGSVSVVMRRLSSQTQGGSDPVDVSPPPRRSLRRHASPVKTRGTSAARAVQGSTNKPSSAGVEMSDTYGNAEVVIKGFLSVMDSNSTTCKAVFVRALYRYLRNTPPTDRLEISEAASASPELVPTLLRCARQLSGGDAQSALRCVGIIGAIAPLPMLDAGSLHGTTVAATASSAAPEAAASETAVPSSANSQHHYHLNVQTVLDWRRLVLTLLDVYSPRALANTADHGMHDRAAYAVQELLRVSVNREREINGGVPLREDEVVHVEELHRYTWWSRLSSKAQRMAEGFTSTRYTLVVRQSTEFRSPAYWRGMPYAEWLFALFQNLSSRCRGVLAEVVATFRNVAKRDHSVRMFLIPYMLVHLLEQGDGTTWDDIHTELNVIFLATTTDSDGNELQQSLRSQVVLEDAPSRRASAHPVVEEHVRYALHLLEDVQHLQRAMLRIGRKLVPFECEDGSDEVCLRLSECYRDFLDGIPWHRRALAAIEAGSNMHALRSLECQRRFPKVSEAIAAVPLQRIFAALDDRDSSRSIHRLSHGLTPEVAAFSFENNGDWQLALQNCELVLQHDPLSIPHQFTSLRCMRQLGQLHLMSRYAAALLASTQAPAQSSARLEGFSTLRPSDTAGMPADMQQAAATLQNYANEAAWRLGEWDSVNSDPALPPSVAVPLMEWIHYLDSDNSTSASSSAQVQRGHMRAAARVFAAATRQREKLTPFVQASSHDDYAIGYPFVVTLHALADVELAAEVVSRVKQQERLRASAGNWQHTSAMALVPLFASRMAFTDATLEAREPLFSLHRAIYRALGMQDEVMETWLQHARLLRDAGFGEAALNAVRQSEFEGRSNGASRYVLTAELLHEIQTPRQAIEFAQEHFSNEGLPRAVRAELKVLVTKWTMEIGSQTPKEVIASYEAALALDSSESVHHHLALFYDKLYAVSNDGGATSVASAGGASANEVTLGKTGSVAGGSSSRHLQQQQSPGARSAVTAGQRNAEVVRSICLYAIKAIGHFGEALLRGYNTMSVSLPRMLTLWLDSAAVLCDVMESDPTNSREAEELQSRLNKLVEAYFLDSKAGRSVAPCIIVSAMPQLLSRLCHHSPQVVSIITRVVVHLMSHYPQQCLWMVLPIAFSKQTTRAEIAKQRIIHAFVEDSTNKKHLENAFAIFTSLIDLCTCPAKALENNAKLTKQPFIQRIESMLPSARFIVPTMANLTPHIVASTDGSVDAEAEVFPGTPTFERFDDRVQIMSSLQRPKRVWVHTNEGHVVSFLCKAKDEPRKDIRMMEIAGLMNTFFVSDADARRKQFALRRYAIAALNDDCAVIEWVNEISPIRNVVSQCYSVDGTGVRINQVKAWYAKVENKSLSKMGLFTSHILPAAPPVFHQWFDMNFSDSQAWYNARNLFTQSTALWSIAGHIVGLGDRHGENLMVDTTRGELMHVDFACMFDKGETLEVPERVRFRLTQNMVDGMGILGVDGPFRAHCEITLRCQMRNKNAVMSVIETLLHDPLVEWTSRSSRNAVDPKRLIGRVSRRLNGFLDLFSGPREVDTLALNVEGQVSRLISHSSALENLCEMYIWWMAWI